MALLSRADIMEALKRLGKLALDQGTMIDLVIVGGAAMALGYDARESTRDVDVIILAPMEAAAVRVLAHRVGEERGWPADWLNDGVKGFLVPGTEMKAWYAFQDTWETVHGGSQ